MSAAKNTIYIGTIVNITVQNKTFNSLLKNFFQVTLPHLLERCIESLIPVDWCYIKPLIVSDINKKSSYLIQEHRQLFHVLRPNHMYLEIIPCVALYTLPSFLS